jgi:hypothetical protein
MIRSSTGVVVHLSLLHAPWLPTRSAARTEKQYVNPGAALNVVPVVVVRGRLVYADQPPLKAA